MGRMPRNAEYTRIYNRNLIVRRLRRAQLSRAELARESGLTRASVSLLTDELIEEGLIVELEPVVVGRGRTPAPLAIRPGVHGAIGVYLSRDGCRIGLIDLDGTVVFVQEVKMDGDYGLPELESAVKAAADQARALHYTLLGVGVSAPGPLDTESGCILNPPRFARWQYTAVVKALSARTGLKVWLENSACSLALYGSEQADERDFLLLLVDSGVGSGVISGGKLLHSAGGFTSELGHTTISFEGKPCSCGGRGCLEAYASMPALLENTPYRTWKELIAAVDTQMQARALLEREADYLAAGIGNMVNLVSVRTVCLTGDICEGFEHLRPLLEERLSGRLLARRDGVRLTAMQMDHRTQVAAAATMVFTHFLESPR